MPESARAGGARRRWPALAALLVLAALGWAGWQWAGFRARAVADATAAQAARAHAGLLASELQKFRLLPLVLGEYPDVAATLGGAGPRARRLDAKLELLAARTDAAAIYVIGADGRTVSASNWRLPSSFVGRYYGFRPYFRDAMRTGASEMFALGTVSGRPGLYLARRVDRGGRALGAVVVKVEFDRVEAAWARSPGISIVTDAQGVILVTGMPAWRFRTTGTLDERTLADARASLQFGADPPPRAPVRLDGRDAVVATGGLGSRYRVAAEPAALGRSRLLHLAPLAPPLAAARSQALLWLLGAALVGGVAAAFAIRSAETRRLQRQARAELEGEVARRTAELRDANARLIVESDERAEADLRFRAAREELAQANRLGSLGQITAGVAHEINQPVAAIRAYAENATTFLDRDRGESARDNLGRIVDLTDRIGRITDELRGFARRKTPTGGCTTLGEAVDGMLLLLGARARGIVLVEIGDGEGKARVAGDRIRLEQVLINLVGNALDAVAGIAGARVALSASSDAGTIRVVVADDGPGVDPAIADTLFTPFTTAKPGGLGLGLAIARDIAREFGGDLAHAPRGRGTAFVLTLKRA